MKSTNCVCTQCGVAFHMKPSQLARYKRAAGTFCSVACAAQFKKSFYAGSRNPNYKGRNTDADGYRLYVPNAGGIASDTYLGKMKLHQAVCCMALGITKMPKGLHIHHRDCDVLNNEPWNLAVMTISDHKWLHKQFGNATLWALMHGKAPLEDLVSWSDDPFRAEALLISNIAAQAVFAKHFNCTNDMERVAAMRPTRVEFVVTEDFSTTRTDQRLETTP